MFYKHHACRGLWTKLRHVSYISLSNNVVIFGNQKIYFLIKNSTTFGHLISTSMNVSTNDMELTLNFDFTAWTHFFPKFMCYGIFNASALLFNGI